MGQKKKRQQQQWLEINWNICLFRSLMYRNILVQAIPFCWIWTAVEFSSEGSGQHLNHWMQQQPPCEPTQQGQFFSKQGSAAQSSTSIYSIWCNSSANSSLREAASLELVHLNLWQSKAHTRLHFNSCGDLLCSHINIKTYFDFYFWVSSRVNLKLSASVILIKNKWLIVQVQGLLTQATNIKANKAWIWGKAAPSSALQ